MKISELTNAPAWLIAARTEDANVEIIDGWVVWKGGTWKGGTWEGGTWEGGTWEGGIWEGGIWEGGIWRGIQNPDVVQYYNPERMYPVLIATAPDEPSTVRIDSGCRHFDSWEVAETHWAAYPETLRLLWRFKPEPKAKAETGQ